MELLTPRQKSSLFVDSSVHTPYQESDPKTGEDRRLPTPQPCFQKPGSIWDLASCPRVLDP